MVIQHGLLELLLLEKLPGLFLHIYRRGLIETLKLKKITLPGNGGVI